MKQDKFFRNMLENFFRTIVIFAGMICLSGLLGYIFAGITGVLWASTLALGMMLISPRLSPALVLRRYDARPLSIRDAPVLYQILQALATRAKLNHLPQLYYIPSEGPTAFAVGTRKNAAIVLTDGLLRQMNRQEISGILAHEISHISHNDIKVMSIADMISRATHFLSISGQILLFLNLPLLLLGKVTFSWLAIFILIIAPALSQLLQLALSRTREYDADLGAVRLTNDPEGLARALQKLSFSRTNIFRKIFMSPTNIHLLRSHPPTCQRIERLLSLKDRRSNTFRGAGHDLDRWEHVNHPPYRPRLNPLPTRMRYYQL